MVEGSLNIYFCSECNWESCVGGIGLKNECPNCRNKGLNYVCGTKDELKKWHEERGGLWQ